MTDQPQPDPAQQQVQLTPWSWQFQQVGINPVGAPIVAILIQRPPAEQLALIAATGDLKRFHAALGDAIRQFETGLILPG